MVHVLLGHGRVDHQVRLKRRSRWVTRERIKWGVQQREKREVSPNVVRGRISHDHIFESAGKNLIIVGGIAPCTNTRG